jgi:hypothetical protein
MGGLAFSTVGALRLSRTVQELTRGTLASTGNLSIFFWKRGRTELWMQFYGIGSLQCFRVSTQCYLCA